MKNVLLIGVCIGLLVLNACNKKDPEVNPLVNTWRLDEVAIEVKEPGYESNDFSGDATGNYSLAFRSDLTYTRTVGEGGTAEEEIGDWEQDEDIIELDPEAGTPKQSGYFYRFTILGITDRELDIEFEENSFAFADAKITEWVSDGTLENIDGTLTFTVTETELDSIYNNFLDDITEVYNLNFDIN